MGLFMRSLTSFLTECEQKYEFKVKIACADDMGSEEMDRLEHALKAYGLSSVSKPKRLPPTTQKNEFPSADGCDVFLMNATLSMPCTDEQLRQVISDQGRFPLSSIKVTPAQISDEDALKAVEDDAEKEPLLTSELEKGEDGQPLAGQKHLDSFLKELESQKMEFASKEKTKDAKTSNDDPQNNKSPITAAKGNN